MIAKEVDLKIRFHLIPVLSLLFLTAVFVPLSHPAFAVDKMTVSISAKAIRATPEWQKYLKIRKEITPLKEAAKNFPKGHPAYVTLMNDYKRKISDFRKTSLAKKARRLRAAKGKSVTCYGSCSPGRFLPNALKGLANGLDGSSGVHCIGNRSCKSRPPSKKDLANAGYRITPKHRKPPVPRPGIITKPGKKGNSYGDPCAGIFGSVKNTPECRGRR